MRHAHKSIRVVDPYMDAAGLERVLASAPAEAEVQILSIQDHSSGFRNMAPGTLRQQLEVHFSRDFHDRVLVLNGTEYYQFGTSLDAVARDRTSIFVKLTSKSMIEELEQRFTAAWAAARPLSR